MCERCEELEEEVLQLKQALYGEGWTPPKEFGLTNAEIALVRVLAARERATPHWLIHDALRRATPFSREDTHPRNVQVYICKIRAKLRPFGLTIETEWGYGYRLTPESRHRLLNESPLREMPLEQELDRQSAA